jgi:hypothetical protein
MMRVIANSFAVVAAGILLGCHSKVVDVTLTNVSQQPVSTISVDYPGATFGKDRLNPGQNFHYAIKPVDSGQLKIQFADAEGHTHNVTGPAVKKGDEGSIQISFEQSTATARIQLSGIRTY